MGSTCRGAGDSTIGARKNPFQCFRAVGGSLVPREGVSEKPGQGHSRTQKFPVVERRFYQGLVVVSGYKGANFFTGGCFCCLLF